MNLLMQVNGEYIVADNKTILEVASQVIGNMYPAGIAFTQPAQVKTYLINKMAKHEQEVFSVLFLDVQNKLIEFKEMFFGTITQAAVYPREIAKHALQVNASAIIICHNHPSGIPEPSTADRILTDKIKASLELLDIRLLDHIIVAGNNTTSFSENGLI